MNRNSLEIHKSTKVISNASNLSVAGKLHKCKFLLTFQC